VSSWVCEFGVGVGSGRNLRMTQETLPLVQPIHGFETFTGLRKMPLARCQRRAGELNDASIWWNPYNDWSVSECEYPDDMDLDSATEQCVVLY